MEENKKNIIQLILELEKELERIQEELKLENEDFEKDKSFYSDKDKRAIEEKLKQKKEELKKLKQKISVYKILLNASISKKINSMSEEEFSEFVEARIKKLEQELRELEEPKSKELMEYESAPENEEFRTYEQLVSKIEEIKNSYNFKTSYDLYKTIVSIGYDKFINMLKDAEAYYTELDKLEPQRVIYMTSTKLEKIRLLYEFIEFCKKLDEEIEEKDLEDKEHYITSKINSEYPIELTKNKYSIYELAADILKYSDSKEIIAKITGRATETIGYINFDNGWYDSFNNGWLMDNPYRVSAPTGFSSYLRQKENLRSDIGRVKTDNPKIDEQIEILKRKNREEIIRKVFGIMSSEETFIDDYIELEDPIASAEKHQQVSNAQSDNDPARQVFDSIRILDCDRIAIQELNSIKSTFDSTMLPLIEKTSISFEKKLILEEKYGNKITDYNLRSNWKNECINGIKTLQNILDSSFSSGRPEGIFSSKKRLEYDNIVKQISEYNEYINDISDYEEANIYKDQTKLEYEKIIRDIINVLFTNKEKSKHIFMSQENIMDELSKLLENEGSIDIKKIVSDFNDIIQRLLTIFNERMQKNSNIIGNPSIEQEERYREKVESVDPSKTFHAETPYLSSSDLEEIKRIVKQNETISNDDLDELANSRTR